MSPAQYELLIRECDLILDRFAKYPSIVAIPWLHVLNNHPNTLHKYEVLVQKKNIWNETARVARCIGYMGYKLLHSLNARKISSPAGKTDVLFISHFVHADKAMTGADFYYGILPEFLVSKGMSTLTGYIDHTPGSNKNSLTKGILFPKTISLKGEWHIILQCIRSCVRLCKAARRETNQGLKKCLHEAALQAISPQTSAALRLYENVRKLVKTVDPAAIIVTWEGWSWERMAFLAARMHNRDIYCIGYQHTILFPGSHALKRSLGKMYDPDTILTLGDISQHILEGSDSDFPDTSFVRYGSHRKTVASKEDFSKQRDATFLVTPEGIESEAVLLFDFAVSLAHEMPGAKFIFRTHPVLPFTVLIKKYIRFSSLPVNCIISDQADIDRDFERSNFLLYRGSSVVLYAVLKGLRPVYYHLPGELSIDPLYALKGWRITISYPYELKDVFDAGKQLDSEQEQSMSGLAKEFCNAYVHSADPETIYSLLSSRVHNN